MADRPHLTLVEPPPGVLHSGQDALDRHELPSLPELAVKLVQARTGIRVTRREILLKAWAAGHEGRDVLLNDPESAYALYGMRMAYRRTAKMLRQFDVIPAPKR